MSRTLCPVCNMTWDCKEPSGCVCFIEKVTIDMMRHVASHPSYIYYYVDVNSKDWSRWKDLEQLGLACGGAWNNFLSTERYFFLTVKGFAFLDSLSNKGGIE